MGQGLLQDPSKIGGTSEVFINKQGRKISWYYSDKLATFPPTKPDDDFGNDDDEATDEEDPESQESHGWLETGASPPKQPDPQARGPSGHKGKSVNMGGGESTHNGKACSGESSDFIMPDIVQEIQAMASEMINADKPSVNQVEELAKLGFISEEEDKSAPTTMELVLETSQAKGMVENNARDDDIVKSTIVPSLNSTSVSQEKVMGPAKGKNASWACSNQAQFQNSR